MSRIALVGAPNTGKTTLARILVNDLAWKPIPEIAHIAKEKGYVLNEEGNYDTQRFILTEQIKFELDNLEDNLVCDRCTVDLIAHVKHLLDAGRLTQAQSERLTVPALAWALGYDLIIWTAMGDCPIEDNGIRSVSAAYHQAINDNIDSIFNDLGLSDHVPVLYVSGTVEERLARVKNTMSKMELI